MGKSSISISQFIFALVISVFGFKYLVTIGSMQSFETLAMGSGSSMYQAKNENGEIFHFLHIDSSEDKAFSAYAGQISDSVICFLGNSQSHSINQFQNSNKNYIELVSRNTPLKPLAFTYPNANLQEHFLTLDYIYKKVNVKKLVLPVFMDDLREDGVRKTFFSLLFDMDYVIEGNSNIANLLNKELSISSESEVGKTNGKQTTQDFTEEFLNEFLTRHSNFWAKREQVRGNLITWLYKIRNTVFGIRPGTTRKMIYDSYQRNFEALKGILDLSKDRGTLVYLYIPPIRSDVDIPYDKGEYKKFKVDLLKLVSMYPNAKLKDYSTIVPGKWWGYKDPTNLFDKYELDFMHFQFEGHKILSDSLVKFVN